LRTIFVRLYGSDSWRVLSRGPLRLRPAVEQEIDQIVAAILELYVSGTSGSSTGSTGRRFESPSSPEIGGKKSVEDVVRKALSNFTWTNGADILSENTEHEQNFLHLCAIGNYRGLLDFLLKYGCIDPARKEKKDTLGAGRTAAELAKAMDRHRIEEMLMWDISGEKDVRGSDKLQQIRYAVALDISHCVDLLFPGRL
jgi:hypothetical protein